MESSTLKLHLYHPSPTRKARGPSQKGLEECESRVGGRHEIMFPRQGRWNGRFTVAVIQQRKSISDTQGGEETGSSDPTLAEQPLAVTGLCGREVSFFSTLWPLISFSCSSGWSFAGWAWEGSTN